MTTKTIARIVALGLLLLLLLAATVTDPVGGQPAPNPAVPAYTGCTKPPFKPGYAPCGAARAWVPGPPQHVEAIPAPTPDH